jgi:tetratricopeptide (TPR) repeat protein
MGLATALPKLVLLFALGLVEPAGAAEEGKSLPAYTQFLDAFDYDKPAESETRLVALARDAETAGDREVLADILAQIARTQGMQSRFDEGHATLARAEALAAGSMKAAARIAIERGRLYRSGGKVKESKPFFLDALDKAKAAGDDDLALDAIHMIAVVVPFDEAKEWTGQGLAYAAQSDHQKAVHWAAVLHNNLGWSHVSQEDYAGALGEFEDALKARKEEKADAETIRIAEYSIGFAWRKLGRVKEALDLQMRIAKEAEASGKPDRFFEKEVAECLLAIGRDREAKDWSKKALSNGSELLPPEDRERLQAIANGMEPDD